MRESGDSQWLITGQTRQGKILRLGPYEKRYAEQLLADIRNHVANGDEAAVEATSISYAEVELATLGMEQYS